MKSITAAVIAVLALGTATPAASARAATKRASLSGSIGATAPARGRALVRAVSLADRSIVAARTLPNNGAFKLSLPAGSYLMVGTVLSDTRATTERIAVTLKPGQKRTKVKLTTKLRKPKARARASYKTQGGRGRKGVSAVGINPFRGPPATAGELHYLAQGAADLMTVDLVDNVARKCPSKVLVHEVSPAIVKALQAEATLGRSPYADRSSFPPAHRIVSNVRVDGVISGDGASATSTITIKDTGTGEIVATLTEPLGDDPFAALARQTANLTEIVCDRVGGYDVKLDLHAGLTSAFYTASGQFRGTLIAEQETPSTWSGSADFEWADSTFAPSDGCSLLNPLAPRVKWSAEISTESADRIRVSWNVAGDDHVTVTRDCPPENSGSYDPPPDTRAPGVSIGSPEPMSFTLPKAGGNQTITGDAAMNTLSGTLTVRKVKTP